MSTVTAPARERIAKEILRAFSAYSMGASITTAANDAAGEIAAIICSAERERAARLVERMIIPPGTWQARQIAAAIRADLTAAREATGGENG